jgi:hypothetical protein
LIDQKTSDHGVAGRRKMHPIGLQIAGSRDFESGGDADDRNTAPGEPLRDGCNISLPLGIGNTEPGVVASGLKEHKSRSGWNGVIKASEHLARGVAGNARVDDAHIDAAGAQQAFDDGRIRVCGTNPVPGRVTRAECDDLEWAGSRQFSIPL